jgi:dienelactone hydrolase
MERVTFRSSGENSTPLVGYLLRPAGAGPFPAMVLLHGCGGLFNRDGDLSRRHADWAQRFVAAGYVVLFPDSFNPRGVRSVCTSRDRVVSPQGRARDALGAAAWLRTRRFVMPARIAALGWSNGGSTVLRLVAETRVADSYAAAVAFYPGCTSIAEQAKWQARIPLLIQIGEADDWTPAEPCRQVAASSRNGRVQLDTYPGAYHDFDAPDMPVRERRGVAYSARGDGVVHVGTNEQARQAAIAATLQFLSTRLGAAR